MRVWRARTGRIGFVAAAIICAAGCAAPRSAHYVDPIFDYTLDCTNVKHETRYFGRKHPLLNPIRYRLPDQQVSLYAIATGMDDVSKDDSAKRESARNTLIEVAMNISDEAVSEHLSRVTGLQIEVNVLLGAAQLTTAGLATVSTGAAARAFAAATAGLIGAKSLFNEEVFRNALVETLVNAIISDRNELRARIQERMNYPIHVYPVQRAMLDVADFHSRGSFYHGLALIREAAEEANRARRAQAEPEAAKLNELRDRLLHQLLEHTYKP